mgnify:CR=1 FL=1
MSLNIGGLYVGVKEGTTPETVADCIERYWLAIGAKPIARAPLEVAPLSLAKTAELAFAVTPVGEDERRKKWIAVYDSERYRADPALALHLSKKLGVPVVFYEISGASGDYAFTKVYGDGGPKLPKRADTQRWIEGFPYALLYFDQLEKTRIAAADFRVFGFEAVPYRPKAKYSGPSPAETRELAVEAQIAELAVARDAAGVRRLGTKSGQALLKSALHGLDRCDLRRPRDLKYVLALADLAIKERADLGVIVEAAVRASDDTLLASALRAIGKTNYLWGILEARGIECSERGEHAIAHRLLRACVEGPSPSPTAWNNHAHTLAKLAPKERPRGKDLEATRKLLTRALEVGPANVSIFHNVARAAAAIGDEDLALEAIEGAAQSGYERMDSIRTDDDLRGLFNHSRFRAVFETKARRHPPSSGPDQLAALTISLRIRGKPHVVYRAVVAMVFYFGGPFETILPRMGRLLDAYRADVPAGVLAFYYHGGFKPLGKAKATKDRKDFETAQRGARTLHYRSTEGDATEYQFEVLTSESHGGGSVLLTFPLDAARDPDSLFERFVGYASRAESESAHAGYASNDRKSASYEGVSWHGDGQDRFLAMQGRNAWWEAGNTPPAHWAVWLSSPLEQRLGGAAALRKKVGAAQITEASGGVAIRTARHVPLAPRANPQDCGAIPDVARALAPLRIKATGERNIAYLARWDDLAGGAFDNG